MATNKRSDSSRSMFVFVDAVYDRERDIQEVEQMGAIDLRQCYVNGVVPGSVPLNEMEFNGVSSPSSLMCRPQDVFERLRQREYVTGLLQQMNDADKKRIAEKALSAAAAVNQVSAPQPVSVVTSGES